MNVLLSKTAAAAVGNEPSGKSFGCVELMTARRLQVSCVRPDAAELGSRAEAAPPVWKSGFCLRYTPKLMMTRNSGLNLPVPRVDPQRRLANSA